MHTNSKLWILLFAAIFRTSLAVPSATLHRDHARLHEIARERPVVLPEPHSYYNLWSRASARAIDWVWDLLDVGPNPQPALTKHSRPGPPRRLLAQYGDQLVLRFNLTTEEEAHSLSEASEILFLDVWASGSDWVDIRLAKDVIPALLTLLPHSLQSAHRPLFQGSELAQAILDTYPSTQPSTLSNGFGVRRAFSTSLHETDESNDNVFFAEYQPLSVIYHWSRLLQSLFATHVQLISVGKSSEGRDIEALRVGVRPTDPQSQSRSQPRKTIVVIGGQHAREWISVATVNYVAYSIIKQYGQSSSMTDLLDEVDLVFVPTLNPDGYQYSFDVDRLWRKTRSANALSFCPGVDLDRCWNFKWNGERTIDNPCSENYAGESAWEAVEARSFAEWARNETLNNNVQFVGLLDLHSYSQQILYPYSFSCGESPPTLEDLMEMGQGLSKAIRNHHGEDYEVVSACEGNTAGSGEVLPKFGGGGGSLLDWFYHELGVRNAFQIKLRDKGVYGFLLPKEYIVPTGSEILSAVEWFAKGLADEAYSATWSGPRPQTQLPLTKR